MEVASRVKPGVLAVLLTQSIAATGTMAVMPTLPFFAMQRLGASALEVSLLASCYNFAQFICSPAVGALSDRIGRKWVMLGGLLLQAFSNCIQAEADSAGALLLARGLIGIAASTGPVEMAYIMDWVQDEKWLSHVLAMQRVVCNAGALLGPLLAHSLERFGFPTLCRGLACINLSCMLIGSILWDSNLPFTDGEAVSSSSSSSRPGEVLRTGGAPCMRDNCIAVISRGGLCYLLSVSFAFTFSCGVSDGPEPLFLKERFGFQQAQFGWYFMVANASTLLWSPLVPLLIAHFGSLNACAAGCFGNAGAVIALIALRGVTAVPYFYVAATVGLFGSMVGLGFMGLVSKNCPRNLLGTMLGLKSSLDGMAGTAAPAVGGCLYYIGSLLPYTATAAVSAFVAFLYISLPPEVVSNKNDLSEELKPLMKPKLKDEDQEEMHPPQAGMKRVASAGLPMSLYAGKNFSSQYLLNQLSLVMDPELKSLYNRTMDKIEKEKGMRPSATIGDSMFAAEGARSSHSRNLSEERRGSSHDALVSGQQEEDP
mmetsp:Transcript_106966/g.190186  ORF Transcript_106966/g.190186 Transcript_106966/m.190186 type:complete len:540 (-) Transcript_106966:52-1671(-)|eukprot:CAMPEP_0197648848 /NCGR_PEP_ID=MMETSP1338-20131121/27995_1 /TAXON_ID=43686 ORGANISM="Pelagodinium beii, Strain RCC1491" /NCGR_SAMPLE_ID=MMETSP1338 /ASSEMBLY_ACC=CAM_ASM_000754 /LENGTH=539 /DNA_ID=CAMNT_0043222913 /DNA_START=142 /DNA_END=1761 /DNA_ORIENTATION=+